MVYLDSKLVQFADVGVEQRASLPGEAIRRPAALKCMLPLQ